MKLKDCREAYYEHSGKASDTARNLAFAGIAVVWIFRTGQGLECRVPPPLLLPLLVLALSLGLDLLHYVAATVIWGSYHRYKERKGVPQQEEFEAPIWFNRVTIGIFILKVSGVAIAYCLLVSFIWGRWVSESAEFTS